MKIRDLLLLAKAAGKLLEAEILLSYFLNKERSFLIAHSEFEISSDFLEQYNSIWHKILDGYPIAYVFHKKEFYGREFYVDERVLIPRPETECLVEVVLKMISDELLADNGQFLVYDVATGSACIGITLIVELLKKEVKRENLNFFLTDISDDALAVAKINVAKFELDDLCEIKKSDLLNFNSLPKINILIANLPYIGRMNNNFVQESVKKYEPNLALFSGDDGLDLYRKLFDQMQNIRFDIAAFEFGDNQKDVFEKLIKEKLPNYKYSFYKDLAGMDRGVVLFF